MGLRAETHDEIRKELVTKIHGQPMDHDITTLVKELVVIAASILSRLGRGNYGHAGIIVETTKYLNMAGVPFIDPIHPEFIQQVSQQQQQPEQEPKQKPNAKKN